MQQLQWVWNSSNPDGAQEETQLMLFKGRGGGAGRLTVWERGEAFQVGQDVTHVLGREGAPAAPAADPPPPCLGPKRPEDSLNPESLYSRPSGGGGGIT